ncbi:hypothetical protein IC63_01075 [Paracoccus sphaerophysae]|uniref:Uncharacterized protein n=1 Tax=Paracoccus sphaerophysae TaxID=690417 RepID=A0A099FGT2_9RHOB|nr:hypothetical protein IC63_01075 [Paracoccus sphaerophysae]
MHVEDREQGLTPLVQLLTTMNMLSSTPLGAADELDNSFSAFSEHNGTTVSSKSVPLDAHLE